MLSQSWWPFFDWCGRTWLGRTVRDVTWAFPVIESIHLLALAVLLGSVLIINLRVFGLGKKYGPAPVSEFEPWIVASILILIATGIPMMMSEPMKCFESYSFPIKMMLLAIAIVWHFTVRRKWSGAGGGAWKSKLAACISIALWSGIGVAGKGIPYV